MFDLSRLTEGIEFDDPNRRELLCERLRDEMKEMSGKELACFLSYYGVDLVSPGVVITFKIPFTSDFLQTFFRECKREDE